MPYKDSNSSAAKESLKRRQHTYQSKHKEERNRKAREKTSTGYNRVIYATEAGKRRAKSRTLKFYYGIDIEQFETMIASQSDMCALCGEPLALDGKLTALSPSVDHDHSCCNGTKSCGKCIRGIIHRQCNAALGLFGDNPNRLLLAFEYLERYPHGHP